MSEDLKSIYDDSLSKVEGLSWLPWVGKNYSQAACKILVVAESHYTHGDRPDSVEQSKSQMLDDVFLTREVVLESPVGRLWQNNMFDNLHRVLVGTNDFEPSGLWDNIAFYNHVQRPMDYNGSYKERPNSVDFIKGWEVFLDVVNILRPDLCIYVGLTASNTFNQAMESRGVSHSKVEWVGESQGGYPRRMSVSLVDFKLPILAVKHTSKYFVVNFWRSFLFRNAANAMRYLALTSGVGEAGLLFEPCKEEPDKDWIPGLPMDKGHKPIMACDYTKIEDSDVRFISVGRAIYARDEEVSVKIWRHNGERWKRTSEEVPVARLSDAFLMLLSAVKTVQDSEKKDDHSYLREVKVSMDDMDFLSECISASGERLKVSLKEIKRLLSTIDIDRL